MNKIKVFISQVMRGLTNKEILETRDNIIKKIDEHFKDTPYEIIDSFKPEMINNIDENINGKIYMLGEAIKQLAGADIVFFADNWYNGDGCFIELEICKRYGIKYYFVNEIEGVKDE